MLGSGGREHALAWKLAQSPTLTRLFAAPGNPGIAHHAELVPLDVADHAAVVAFCRDRDIGLVVIGPEAPLVAGLADDLRAAGIAAFGPSAQAARLEGSKAFTKALCAAHGIPTAAYAAVTSRAEADAALARFGAPVVVKADGLAAGKGVTVALTIAEADAALDALFGPKPLPGEGVPKPKPLPFRGGVGVGESKARTAPTIEVPTPTPPLKGRGSEGLPPKPLPIDEGVLPPKPLPFRGGVGVGESTQEPDEPVQAVIEAFLEGEEVSLFALTDGRTVVALGSAQDHKRVGDGDVGPNTGGMGAYSPARVLTPALEARALAEIVRPTVDALAAMGCPYVGVLYAGLMLTADGPQLIEYNARFGDPEAQVLMPRLEDDLVDLLHTVATGGLADRPAPTLSDRAALTVVMAADGYPGTPRTGGTIAGIDSAEATGAIVFQAGTRRAGDVLVAAGGRVLAVTATGASVAAAQTAAYRAVDAIDFPTGFSRRDIGWREVARERAEP